MKLLSYDGGYVELIPVASQLEVPEPAETEDDCGESDDWLVTRGRAGLSDQREWAATLRRRTA